MGALKKCVEQVLTDVSSTAEDSETVAADIASVALSCCIWRGRIRTHSRMMFRVSSHLPSSSCRSISATCRHTCESWLTRREDGKEASSSVVTTAPGFCLCWCRSHRSETENQPISSLLSTRSRGVQCGCRRRGKLICMPVRTGEALKVKDVLAIRHRSIFELCWIRRPTTKNMKTALLSFTREEQNKSPTFTSHHSSISNIMRLMVLTV